MYRLNVRDMSHLLSTQGPASACLLAVLRAGAGVARARLGAGVEALLLAVLLRLFARAEAAWELDEEDAEAEWYGGIAMPTLGSAPYAACVEAGLIADWILPAMPNRGMRRIAAPPRAPRIPRPVRAPPPRGRGQAWPHTSSSHPGLTASA